LSEVVAVLHRFDLAPAASLMAQRGVQALLVDPVMYDRCVGHGIPAPLVHTRSTADIACGAFAEAQAAARALCRDLGPVLADLAPAALAGAWSAHRIFHLFWTLHGYRRIWPEVLASQSHAHWHLLLPQQAHTYGAHSFVPGVLLLQALRERGVPHTAYGFDCPGLEPYQLPDLRRLPECVELLAHLPTCKADAAHIADELRATSRPAALLSAQVYDVALDGMPATGLVDLATVRELLGPAAGGRVEALQAPLKVQLRAHLLPWLGPTRFMEQQVQALWEALEAQALLYLWLERHFAGRLPRQLLISNHDATIHGALTSFALQHGVRVLVLPHSRVHNVPIKTEGVAPLCLHHAMQGGPCVDLADRMLPAGLMRVPAGWTTPAATGELRTLGLVLNGLSVNGMCMVDFEAYADSLRQWCDWAQARGLALKLRTRIAETPAILLAQRLQMDVQALMLGAEGSLADFASGCDLTLGFDVPTSGLHDLVRQGRAVMQVEHRPLARHEWAIVDERVVPRYSAAEARERLALMQANPALFLAYRRELFDTAQARELPARPLRDWLAED
jgi:hypothetical protein